MQTVQNLFKRDPGFAGIVLNRHRNPAEGIKVQIYNPDGKLLATVYTNHEGWYHYTYKYTGPSATFTVELPDYNLAKSVTVEADSLVQVDFQLP